MARQQHAGQHRHTAQRARAGWLVNMQHLAGRHTYQAVEIARCRRVARMELVHPVRHPLPQGIEFDTLPDAVTIRRVTVFGMRHELGFQQLQLQRHGQAVIQATRPQAGKALAYAEKGVGGQALLAVKIQHAIRIGFGAKILPQLVQLAPDGRIAVLAAWCDAGTDVIADLGVQRLDRVRVILRSQPAAVSHGLQATGCHADRATATGLPVLRTAPLAGTFVAVFKP